MLNQFKLHAVCKLLIVKKSHLQSSGGGGAHDKVIDFNKKFKKASTDPEQVRFCEGFHEPGEVVMPSDAETKRLTCIFCHATVHADPVSGNGDLAIALNETRDKLSNAFIMASPRDHARNDISDYIEFLYNPKQKHGRNGMLPPIVFEKQQKWKPQGV